MGPLYGLGFGLSISEKNPGEISTEAIMEILKSLIIGWSIVWATVVYSIYTMVMSRPAYMLLFKVEYKVAPFDIGMVALIVMVWFLGVVGLTLCSSWATKRLFKKEA